MNASVIASHIHGEAVKRRHPRFHQSKPWPAGTAQPAGGTGMPPAGGGGAGITVGGSGSMAASELGIALRYHGLPRQRGDPMRGGSAPPGGPTAGRETAQ